MGKRTAMVAGLRAMADDLEAGKLPLPYDISPSVFWSLDEKTGQIADRITKDDARKAMYNAPGAWEKITNEAYVTYIKNYSTNVTYNICTSRLESCKQVQVGTKHVEAHDEPVYEWVCE